VNGTPRTSRTDEQVRREAAAKHRAKFAAAAGENMNHNVHRTQIPGQPENTVPHKAYKAKDLSPAAKYADLAKALVDGTTPDRLMELFHDIEKSIHTQNATTNLLDQSIVSHDMPDGWYAEKVRDTWDKSKKSFRKYFLELDIEKFSATDDSITFPAWWHSFCRQVHRIPESFASDQDKLWALQKLVTDDPAQLIAGWKDSPHADAYTSAVQTLQCTYGNNEKANILIRQQLAALLPSSAKASDLRIFLAQINKHRLDLVHTGMSNHQAGIEAMTAVHRVMANPYIDRYLAAAGLYGKAKPSTFYQSDPPKYFVDFMHWFLEQNHYDNVPISDDSGIIADSTVVMAARPQYTNTKREHKPQYSGNSSQKQASNSNQKAQSASQSPPKKQFCCVFCQQNHKNDYCTYNVSTRVSITNRLNLCRCCLKPGHRKEACTSENTCCHCAKAGEWRQHNTALCSSPQALEARMKGLSLDWKSYKELKRNNPGYEAYKAQLLKKRLDKLPKTVRTQVAQIFDEYMDSGDEEEMPTTLDTPPKAETPPPSSEKSTTDEQPKA
jgi:hypothetical protein